MKKKTFTITTPPGTIVLVACLWIVYDLQVALITLLMFFVLGTICENFL